MTSLPDADPSPRGGVSSLEALLARSAPFRFLPPAERQTLAARLRARRFEPGEVVFSEGAAAAGGWLVVSGRARVLLYQGPALLVQAHALGPGEVFGVYCRLFSRAKAHRCTAVADGPLVAAPIADATFEGLMRCAGFSRSACELCSARLDKMRVLAVSAQETVRRRLARTLLRLAGPTGRVEATRHRLAVELGCAQETVFRALAEFRRRGWIATERKAVLLLDTAALMRTSGPGESAARPL